MSIHQHSDRQPPPGQANGPHSQHDTDSAQPGFWRSKTGLVAVGFILIATFLLLSEHRAHALGYLPFLLLLACLFLHKFMHGGHGDHTGHGGRSDRPKLPSGGA